MFLLVCGVFVCGRFEMWCGSGSGSRWFGRVLRLGLGLGLWCTVYLMGLSAAKRATVPQENLESAYVHCICANRKKSKDVPHKPTRRTTIFGRLRSADFA